MYGYRQSNHDNVQMAGLPAGMIRGFTTQHNTLSQNDLEALNQPCIIFAPTNVNQRQEGKLNEEAKEGKDQLGDTVGELHIKTVYTFRVCDLCV